MLRSPLRRKDNRVDHHGPSNLDEESQTFWVSANEAEKRSPPIEILLV